MKDGLRRIANKRSEEGIKFFKWSSGVRDHTIGIEDMMIIITIIIILSSSPSKY